MRSKNTGYKALIALSCVCSLAAAVLLYFAQTVGYDLSIQHFARNSPFAAGAVCAIAAAIILGIVAGVIRARDKENAGFAPASAFGIFAASVTAFMMLAAFILSIRQLSQGMELLPLVRLVLMALSAAFFFLTAARERKSGGGFALLSLCPMLFGLISILIEYFDTSYGMNAPIKTYALLMYIAVTLFFSAEVRVALSRVLPFWYTFFGTCCLALTAGVGLSQTAVALHDTVGHGFSLIDSMLCVCIALFTASRLFSFGAPTEATDADLPAGEKSNEEAADENEQA